MLFSNQLPLNYYILFLNVSDGEEYRRELSLGPISTKGKSEHEISNWQDVTAPEWL